MGNNYRVTHCILRQGVRKSPIHCNIGWNTILWVRNINACISELGEKWFPRHEYIIITQKKGNQNLNLYFILFHIFWKSHGDHRREKRESKVSSDQCLSFNWDTPVYSCECLHPVLSAITFLSSESQNCEAHNNFEWMVISSNAKAAKSSFRR